jgi:hypothetical protein
MAYKKLETKSLGAARVCATKFLTKKGFVEGLDYSIRTPTRVEQITTLLRHHGPLSQKEITDRVKIPKGTVSVLLTQRREFSKNDEGKWYVLST